MCIKQEPDPERRQLQIIQMKNSTFRNLVKQCTGTHPWTRPNMASVIEELQKPPSCSSRPRRTAWGDLVTIYPWHYQKNAKSEPMEPQKSANVDPIASDLWFQTKCTVTPGFLSIDQFLYSSSTFCEKMDNRSSAHASPNAAVILTVQNLQLLTFTGWA